MAQRNQGLARDNNLSEPLDDGQAITNLAGAGVDQDLFIFINNLILRLLNLNNRFSNLFT